MQNYRKWDFLVFTLLTLMSVLNGQTTVFYIIYFFWWNELIRIIIDTLMYKRNPNAVLSSNGSPSFFGSMMQMGVYFVFIVVFFGFMANWNNTHIMMINMQVLFFYNWFFNINLLFVIAERIYLHKRQSPLRISFGTFTPHMLVLHVSIIVGAVLMFFVVRNFPDTFTPNNLWGSVIIILPFLGFKMLMNWWMEPVKTVSR